ncbi:MAG TPA: hypothetical protein VK641_17770 [Terriglobales bacterium]|jgi:hypothetical protein|nr:hypothetical protein [Terriglobales bacterium]
MLGFSTRVLNAGSLLTVIIPAHTIMLIACTLPLLLWFAVLRMTTTPRGHRMGVIAILINLFVISVIFTPARVVLDAQHGSASISRMMFFIPHHQTLPLSEIQGSMVKTSEQSNALVLILSDGHAVQLTPFDQVRGADEAAAAINRFLRDHGGTGSPY